jgi:adenylate cyclase
VERLLESRGLAALGIGFAVFTVLLAARQLGLLESFELSAYDSFVRGRPPPQDAPPVTMVWVTEREVQELGHPLEDRLIAGALSNLMRHGPRAIGVDIYRDHPRGEGWNELREVFLSNPQIVIVEKRPEGDQPPVGPPSFLPDHSQVGFADLVMDLDGVARRGLLMLWEGDQHFVSLSLQLALRYLLVEGITMGPSAENPEWVAIGPTSLPPVDPNFGGYRGEDAGGYQFVFDYRHDGGFPGFTFQELLDDDFDSALVRGKVVIIGTASASVKDDFQIPSGFRWSDSHVHGAELHAHAVDQLIRYAHAADQPISVWSDRVEIAWILAWCLVAALLGVRVQSTVGLLATTVGGLGVLIGGAYTAFVRSLWVPVVPPALGWVTCIGFAVGLVIQRERAERRKLEGIFGKFMSPKLAESLWDNRDIFWHGDRPRPQRATASILLSDLFGYTTRSEKAEAGEVMDWLGTYTEKMTDLVDQHDGMVHDFLGDGLMASFGLPVPRESEEELDSDAVSSVECALAMGDALEELNEVWKRDGRPTARLRVGVLTGPVVIGAIGGTERLKYAAVGNTVNTAARLEAFDKLSFERDVESTCRVLIGQATLDRLGGRFETECLGDHVLKGKGDAVTIYRVLGRRYEVSLTSAEEEGGG